MRQFFLSAAVLCLFTVLFLLCGCHIEHDPVTDAAVAPTCAFSGLTEGAHCGTCGEVLTPQETVPALPHTVVTDKGLEATCTKTGLTEGSHCEVCGTVLAEQKVTEALGHNVVTDKAVSPTCARLGKTEGSHCKTCKLVLVSQKEIPMTAHTFKDDCCTVCKVYDLRRVKPYVSYEGYAYFANAKNGTAMRRFYDYIDADLIDFHLNKERNAYPNASSADYPIVGLYNYKQFGLTLDEAFTVWVYYRKDHPLYYWFAYAVSWSDTDLYIHTVLEHANGVTRAMYNRKIYAGIEEYIACAEGAPTAYDKALAYYDKILLENRYGDKAEGAPEMTEVWAHNILGAFEYNTFVCEGYSKLFQLLLNYSGIENRHIVGDNHAWNLVKLDDGKWYWFDPTWDDTIYGGVCRYEYFCGAESSFADHDPAEATHCSGGVTFYVNMTLPTRATTEYDGANVLELYATFVKDGNTYQRTSYDTLRLVKITNQSAARAEEITYNGVTYTVE